ncbi:uncharacterized protein CDV56_108114 [Aspergillus thermomutatus]|uniref:Uncharacterized protein n=1 Tax=Aspergillus thermomutatus TaxID=41047 RepID=A0A397H3L3_ASPTH|nr:uncharacterized protein CDV56_108114 [Aspergillus thermomutatus]RHZ56294.1 hypothetical protein CDV56_108114 [Aspergillus thermomutatus]
MAKVPNKAALVTAGSFNPVCSFAYAVSREGGRKVLELVGGAKDEAFDVAVMHNCKLGKLNCISIVPEVIHQYFPAQSFGVKSLVDIGNGEKPGPGDEKFENVMGSTENILQSARCSALWDRKCPRPNSKTTTSPSPPNYKHDEASTELRIYFPVARALLEHDGALLEANGLGEFEHQSLHGDYAVLGRRQTEHVRGVASNIVKDGTIYLAKRSRPVRQIAMCESMTSDTGCLTAISGESDYDNGENPDATDNGCVANHGKANCSKKYGLDEGRCTINPDPCMDYSGWFTDWRSHKYLYFLGSACSVGVDGKC